LSPDKEIRIQPIRFHEHGQTLLACKTHAPNQQLINLIGA